MPGQPQIYSGAPLILPGGQPGMDAQCCCVLPWQMCCNKDSEMRAIVRIQNLRAKDGLDHCSCDLLDDVDLELVAETARGQAQGCLTCQWMLGYDVNDPNVPPDDSAPLCNDTFPPGGDNDWYLHVVLTLNSGVYVPPFPTVPPKMLLSITRGLSQSLGGGGASGHYQHSDISHWVRQIPCSTYCCGYTPGSSAICFGPPLGAPIVVPFNFEDTPFSNECAWANATVTVRFE